MKTKVKIKDGSGKISSKDIAELQESLGISFSEEYTDFLLKNNGGFPTPNIFKTKDGAYETDLKVFYGVTDKKAFDLESVNNIFKDRIPAGFISIGGDSIGNQLIMDGKDSLFLFDHETDEYFAVEDGILKFLSSLYSIEEEEATELEIAVQRQDLAYFKMRLNEGYKIDQIQNEFGRTVTQLAASQNKFKLLKFCVQNEGGLGGTVQLAASNNHVGVLEYVVSLGADINEVDELNHDTPLMLASVYGNLEAVRFLIGKGADIHKVDMYENDALNKAYRSDNQELIDYLEKEVYKV